MMKRILGRGSKRLLSGLLCLILVLTSLNLPVAAEGEEESTYTELTFSDFGLADGEYTEGTVGSAGLADWDNVAVSGKIKLGSGVIRIGQAGSGDTAFARIRVGGGGANTIFADNVAGEHGCTAVGAATSEFHDIRITFDKNTDGTYHVTCYVDGAQIQDNGGCYDTRTTTANSPIEIQIQPGSGTTIESVKKPYKELTFSDFGLADGEYTQGTVGTAGLTDWDNVAVSGKIKLGSGVIRIGQAGSGDTAFARIRVGGGGANTIFADNVAGEHGCVAYGAATSKFHDIRITFDKNTDGTYHVTCYVDGAQIQDNGGCYDTRTTTANSPIEIQIQPGGGTAIESVKREYMNLTVSDWNLEGGLVEKDKTYSLKDASITSLDGYAFECVADFKGSAREDAEEETYTELTFSDFGLADGEYTQGTFGKSELADWDNVAVSGKIKLGTGVIRIGQVGSGDTAFARIRVGGGGANTIFADNVAGEHGCTAVGAATSEFHDIRITFDKNTDGTYHVTCYVDGAQIQDNDGCYDTKTTTANSPIEIAIQPGGGTTIESVKKEAVNSIRVGATGEDGTKALRLWAANATQINMINKVTNNTDSDTKTTIKPSVWSNDGEYAIRMGFNEIETNKWIVTLWINGVYAGTRWLTGTALGTKLMFQGSSLTVRDLERGDAYVTQEAGYRVPTENTNTKIDDAPYEAGGVFNTVGDHTLSYTAFGQDFVRDLVVYMEGDANVSGDTDVYDLVRMKRYIANGATATLTKAAKKSADLNSDDSLTDEDAGMLRTLLVKKN